MGTIGPPLDWARGFARSLGFGKKKKDDFSGLGAAIAAASKRASPLQGPSSQGAGKFGPQGWADVLGLTGSGSGPSKPQVGDVLGAILSALSTHNNVSASPLIDAASFLKPYDDAKSAVGQQQMLALAAQQKMVEAATQRAKQAAVADQGSAGQLQAAITQGVDQQKAALGQIGAASQADLAAQGVDPSVMASLAAQNQVGAASANAQAAAAQQFARSQAAANQATQNLRQEALGGLGDSAKFTTNATAQSALTQLAMQRAQAEAQIAQQNAQITAQNNRDATAARQNGFVPQILGQIAQGLIQGQGRDTTGQANAITSLQNWGRGGDAYAAVVKSLLDNNFTDANSAISALDQNWNTTRANLMKLTGSKNIGNTVKNRLHQAINEYFTQSNNVSPDLLSILPLLTKNS